MRPDGKVEHRRAHGNISPLGMKKGVEVMSLRRNLGAWSDKARMTKASEQWIASQLLRSERFPESFFFLRAETHRSIDLRL